jgi:2-keto-4-pentenoate hydratase
MSDERVRKGMDAMLSSFDTDLKRGESRRGWKLGFGTEAAMEKLGTTEPLVGYLLGGAQLESGSTCEITTWANPILEPEIAIHIGREVSSDDDDEESAAAIAGLGPAIELVDLDASEEDPQQILAANIYQRHYVLGAPQTERSDVTGVTASILRNGEVVESTDDVTALTGTPVGLVRRTAAILGEAGERLKEGDVVIGGSIVTGIAIEAGDELTFQIPPLGMLELRF